MRTFATIRHRYTHGARTGFWGFVVVWLNIALQPCAMAFDGPDQPGCDHCPPAHASQHAHHAPDAHQPPMPDTSCVTSPDDCSLLDELKHDGRNAGLKLKDAPSDVPLAVHPATAQVFPARPAAGVGGCPPRRPPPGDQTLLHVLYCVYLD